jgi:hypothetical protein
MLGLMADSWRLTATSAGQFPVLEFKNLWPTTSQPTQEQNRRSLIATSDGNSSSLSDNRPYLVIALYFCGHSFVMSSEFCLKRVGRSIAHYAGGKFNKRTKPQDYLRRNS